MTVPIDGDRYVVKVTGRRSLPVTVGTIGGSAAAAALCGVLAWGELRDDDVHWLTFAAFVVLGTWFLATLAHEIWRATLPRGRSGDDVNSTITVPGAAVDRVIAESPGKIHAIKALREEYRGLGLADAKELVDRRD